MCLHYLTEGVIADYNIYSDPECKNHLDNIQIAIPCPTNICYRDMMCTGATTQYGSEFYVQAGGGFGSGGQLAFTNQQNCPVGGAGGATSVVSLESHCVKVKGVTDSWGVGFFPCGSGGLIGARGFLNDSAPTSTPEDDKAVNSSEERSRRKVSSSPAKQSPRRLGVRQTPTCHRFDANPDRGTWNYEASTPTKRISDGVDCRNSEEPCTLQISQGTIQTWTVTWQVSVGVSISGFSASTTVGGSYADAVTWTQTGGLSVDPGQRGYAGAYTLAVDVPGTYRDCDDGGEYEGSALIPSTTVIKTVVYF